MNIQSLIEHFKNYLSLDEGEIQELKSRIVERKVKRRHFILQEGDVCNKYTFVVEGWLKYMQTELKHQKQTESCSCSKKLMENGKLLGICLIRWNQKDKTRYNIIGLNQIAPLANMI